MTRNPARDEAQCRCVLLAAQVDRLRGLLMAREKDLNAALICGGIGWVGFVACVLWLVGR